MLSRVICHFLEQGSINTINSDTNKLAFYRCSRKMSVFNACVRKGSKVPEEAMWLQMLCKPFVTPCHLGKLKLAFTSPNVILATGVVPKTFWWAELISQFFCYMYYSKNFTCPSGKLRIGFTSPGLLDAIFFARWMTPQGTRTPNRPAQNCNPITSPRYQATVRTTTCGLALSMTRLNPAVVILTDELVVYTFLEVTKIGRKDADPAPDIPFSGLRWVANIRHLRSKFGFGSH